ncbi:hypothetical protein K438DRAFT_100297 [Mycena galopus ATCC 62051]|nr:hypothetical protein K438DRAFT_100297 [Mycena galopus ATCC 62051]
MPNISSLTEKKIRLWGMRANSVPIVSWWRPGHFFVRVVVNDDTQNTAIAVADSGWVSWGEEFHFDVPPTSTMKLILLATHRTRSETTIGWVEERIEQNHYGLVERQLITTEHLPTHLSYHLQLLSSDVPSASTREAAKLRNNGIHNVGAGIPVAMGAALCLHLPGAELQARNAPWFRPETIVADGLNLGDLDDLPESLSRLIKHVEFFTTLINQFSEIHPYAKIACSVLTMAQKVAIAQRERDDLFRELIKVTCEVFAFLNELKKASLENHLETIKLLTLQTTECAYFIRDYTKQKSFILRTGSTLFSGSGINDKIAEYQKKFMDLKHAFQRDSALNTEITVVRIAAQVDQIAAAGELDDLPYASARFDIGKQCLASTRESLLKEIFAWVNESQTETPRIFLLTGAPGTGKSAIAHTVAHRFNELQRLGSSFFFLQEQPERSPDRLFTTIARDLADLDQGWKDALRHVVGPRALRRTASIREQFEEFILKPSQRPLIYFGPVLIVIDALDAIGDQEARETIVSILSSRSAGLPGNFRLLITARPDSDICNTFGSYDSIHCCSMDTVIDQKSNLQDIEEFFDFELSGVPELQWKYKLCHKLVRKSAGDFAWAVFACKFVKNTHSRIKSPAERLRRLLLKTKTINVAYLEAEESDSESDGFFPDRIRDKLQHMWHPHIHHHPPYPRTPYRPSRFHGDTPPRPMMSKHLHRDHGSRTCPEWQARNMPPATLPTTSSDYADQFHRVSRMYSSFKIPRLDRGA